MGSPGIDQKMGAVQRFADHATASTETTPSTKSEAERPDFVRMRLLVGRAERKLSRVLRVGSPRFDSTFMEESGMKNRLIRVIQQKAGEEGAYWGMVGINNHDAAELLPMITATDRAWWWREVTDPDEVIPKGCPARYEPRDNWAITETVRNFDRERSEWGVRGAVFIDSRWTPPRPTYKVGDVIETAEELKRLPDGSVFLDCDGEAWQVRGGMAHEVYGDRDDFGDFHYFPLTVIYLPKVGGGK